MITSQTTPGPLQQLWDALVAIATVLLVIRIVGFVTAILWNVLVILGLKRWFGRLNAWSFAGQLVGCCLLLSLFPLCALLPSSGGFSGAERLMGLSFLPFTVAAGLFVAKIETNYRLLQVRRQVEALEAYREILQQELASIQAAQGTSQQGEPHGSSQAGDPPPQP